MAHLSVRLPDHPEIGRTECIELDDFRRAPAQSTNRSRGVFFGYGLGVYDTFGAEPFGECFDVVTIRKRHDMPLRWVQVTF